MKKKIPKKKYQSELIMLLLFFRVLVHYVSSYINSPISIIICESLTFALSLTGTQFQFDYSKQRGTT